MCNPFILSISQKQFRNNNQAFNKQMYNDHIISKFSCSFIKKFSLNPFLLGCALKSTLNDKQIQMYNPFILSISQKQFRNNNQAFNKQMYNDHIISKFSCSFIRKFSLNPFLLGCALKSTLNKTNSNVQSIHTLNQSKTIQV